MKPPRDNKPYGSIQDLPPSEHPNPNAHPGECILNDPIPFCHDIYHPGVPNPVMVEYHHNHKPKPHRLFGDEFVTKKELNEILRNIAKCKPDTQCAKRTSDYMAKRRYYEDILRKEFQKKGGMIKRISPHYMVVEQSQWLND